MNFINCPTDFYNETVECNASKKMAAEVSEPVCANFYGKESFIFEMFMFLPYSMKEARMNNLSAVEESTKMSTAEN
jgi:hypothetical protein